MQSKTLALFALSASAALASPFHKRAELHHRRFRGTGSAGVRPTGTGSPFPAGNDTDGFFPPTGSASILPISNTFGNVVTGDAVSSCVSTSIVTETSTNLVTVTASAADLANTKVVEAGSVSPAAFYGQSRTRSGGFGESSVPAATDSYSVPSSYAPSAANPSTTFASVPSASPTSVATGSASASPSVSASAPATGSSGGKRGISFNDASLVSKFGSSVSWAYNWASTESESLSVDYVPMMWGLNDVSNFASKVGSATHVLSFNEPDLGEQANIDPATAATKHIEGMKGLGSNVQIGSPAVTNGDSQSPLMGIPWLNKWFEACAGNCPVDFVAFHWYATADSFDYFKQHVEDVVAAAAAQGINKVWLTEFQPAGSPEAQASFMKQAVEYLDSNPAVERYAAFMASEGTMLTGGSLNALGSAYAGA